MPKSVIAHVAVAVDHHVRRLQVAVDTPRSCAAATPAQSCRAISIALSCGMRPMRRSSDGEVFAVHVLHRQEPAAVGVAEVVQAADVLVRDLARDAQLVVELRPARGIAPRRLGQELQRDRLIEREVVGPIDLAHAAAAEQRHEAIAAGDDGAGRKGRQRGVQGGGNLRQLRLPVAPYASRRRRPSKGNTTIRPAHRTTAGRGNSTYGRGQTRLTTLNY